MLKRSEKYLHYVLFDTLKEKNVIPPAFFWIAVATLYAVANAPKNRIIMAFQAIFNRLSQDWVSTTVQAIESRFTQGVIPPEILAKTAPQQLAEITTNYGIIPIKKFLFFIATLVIAYPILISVIKSRHSLFQSGFKRRAIASLAIFAIISVLIVPFRYPLGPGVMGLEYAIRSLEPFSQNADWYYRRLLMLAIANFIHMSGPFLYYILSLACTYFLIFLTLTFIESKIFGSKETDEGQQEIESESINYQKLGLYYLSITTSSYLIFNCQFPGYVDQLFFSLLLLPACIPMTRQGRLATLAFALATHEASAFVFIPIVIFCFPRREVLTALSLVPIYCFIWFAGSGFSLDSPVKAHLILENKTALQYLAENPMLGLAGFFFSYKLLWIITLYILWILWRQGETLLVSAIACIIAFPISTMFLIVDTSRNVGYGFFGMLIAFAILIREEKVFPGHLILFYMVILNIIIPSYYVGLNTGFQTYMGLYHLIPLFPSTYVP
ncbi:hypothetical protein [Coleofasciculus sp. FACHB-129]|uniref:hypothetical protein n=1 Tax=Cyanophyceae TaxID=3028117 RepID=UPI001681DF6C|nr:hypothetical protein [Coleofasciculus sp. FACHB-129]MBD1895367.1 hypothetical protein [Coleofasciculus sp. FACHB-129]